MEVISLAKVSIIVPVYNSAAYLPRCLESLRGQTLRDIEVILVDDGSEDNSADLCAQVASEDKRFHLLRQENAGPTAARKFGLHHATSDYVTFADSDDWMEPAWCMHLYQAAIEADADLSICGHFREQDGKASPQHSSLLPGTYDRNAIEQKILPCLFHDDFEDAWSIYPYLWDKLFKREKVASWQDNVPDEIRLGVDVCVTFPYVVHCSKIVILDDPLYHYVLRRGSVMRALPILNRDIPRYHSLYETVRASWQNQPQAVGLEGQLQRYMLTNILLPRLPFVWLDGSGNETLFPFSGVESGKRIVIYGAGVFGTALHAWLQENAYGAEILWLDARAAALQKEGVPVRSPEAIKEAKYDYVLIAIIKQSTVHVICRTLIALGVPQEKLKCLDISLVTSGEAWKAYCAREH